MIPCAKNSPSIFWVRHISPAAQISRLTPLIRRTTFLAETPRHEFFFCGICSIPLYISRMGSLSPTGNFHPGNCTMTFFAEGACSCFEACKYSFQDRSLRSAALPAVRTPASVRAGALASASRSAVEAASRQRRAPPRTICLLFYHFFCEPHIGDPAGRLPVRPGSPARIFPLIAAPTPAKHCSPLY